jgi:hypothetical protein
MLVGRGREKGKRRRLVVVLENPLAIERLCVIGSHRLHHATALAGVFCACYSNSAGRLRAQPRRRIGWGYPALARFGPEGGVLMPVQTCTKRMPALVLSHPAGQWWNFGIVPPTLYTSPRLVSSAFSQKPANYPRFPLPRWLCLLIPCPWHHEG